VRLPVQCLAALIVAFIATVAASAAGNEVADFYKGKTLQFIIGYPPGGGYDAYARLLVRSLGKHIPGGPTIVINNMPGAASLKAAQFLARIAPKDGLTIGMFNRGLMPKSRLEPKEVDIDFAKFTWIGSMNSDVSICTAWGASGVRNLADLRTAHIVLADTAKNSGAYIYTSLLHNLFPDNTRMMLGYEGSNAIWLAMERGEVDANCNVWAGMKAQKPEWFRDRKANVLVQFSPTRHPDLPEVPLISEIVNSQEQKQALEFLVAADVIARPIVGPPGIDLGRAEALRSAFLAATADPELIAAAEQARLELGIVGGVEAAKIAEKISHTPDRVIQQVRELIKTD